MPDAASTLAFADGHIAPVAVGVGGLMIGVATLAGAWLARRHAARRELCFGAAAGALLVIAGFHLIPDAWAGAREAGISVWYVPAAAIAAFAVAGVAVRRGCTCQSEREAAGGAGAAGALAVHRLLEGAALALTGSLAVAVALVVHALAEGLAAGTLLIAGSRRRAVWWLTAMCVSPIVGALVTEAWPFPARVEPVLLAVAAGVLGQAARVSLAAAFHQARRTWVAMSSPAAATLIAALVTTLAVRGVG
jgi:ZIP family zinc transporter